MLIESKIKYRSSFSFNYKYDLEVKLIEHCTLKDMVVTSNKHNGHKPSVTVFKWPHFIVYYMLGTELTCILWYIGEIDVISSVCRTINWELEYYSTSCSKFIDNDKANNMCR